MNPFEEWISTLPHGMSREIVLWLKSRLETSDGEDYDALAAEFMLGVKTGGGASVDP